MRSLLLVILAVALVACQGIGDGSPSPEERREVTLLLGFRPDVQFAPFYVAQQEGHFAAAGLEVEIRHEQAPDVQRLVASGEAEFGVADATDVMIARTQGLPIRYLSTLYQSFPVALIGDTADVPADPSGLAGMSVGTRGHDDGGRRSRAKAVTASIAHALLVTVEWPTPGITSRIAPGIRCWMRCDHSGGVRRSSPPCRSSVGRFGYGGAGVAEAGYGTSGQRRQRSTSSSVTTVASKGAKVPGGSAARRCWTLAGRWSIGVPASHGTGFVSQVVA